MTITPSKQALREHFSLNRDKFARLMNHAGIYAAKPELKFKHDLTKAEFEYCKRRLQKKCFVVLK